MNKIIAMIPAKIKSQRLAYKNLAILNNKPLIYYAINSAKKSKIFDKIIINSDNLIYKKIAQRYKIDFYLRPKYLGGAKIQSDDIILDFMKKNSGDILVWVNPIAPLLNNLEIKKSVKYFIKNKLNSLITVLQKNVHCVYNSKPVNFHYKGKFARTQDLNPYFEMVYSLMMWKYKSFIVNMEKNNRGVLHGKICYYPVNKNSSLIVKDELDLFVAEKYMKKRNKNFLTKYDRILKTDKFK